METEASQWGVQYLRMSLRTAIPVLPMLLYADAVEYEYNDSYTYTYTYNQNTSQTPKASLSPAS
jgi:hypothetical protein